MAIFKLTYDNYVKPFEGGYAWFKQDKGGETYGGIARNFNPNWKGWPVLDKIKATKYKGKPLIQPDNLTPIPNNTKFKELDPSVEAFFLDLWNGAKMSEIKNQKVADIAFDWLVNSGGNSVRTKGNESYGIDEILINQFKQSIPIDSKFDKTTIDSINRVNPDLLYNAIIKARKQYYDVLVKNDPTQARFYDGWIKRISKFEPVAISATIGLLILLAVGLYLISK